MKLTWGKDPNGVNRYVAESHRYRFVMVAVPRRKPELWVQNAGDEWGTNPIDQRTCRSRRGAERIAQRFEDAKQGKRLRLSGYPACTMCECQCMLHIQRVKGRHEER